MHLRTFFLILLLMVVGCSKHKDQPKVAASTPPAAAEVLPAAIGAPKEEPSEEVLRKLEFQVYDELEKAGGLAMKIQTSEQQATAVPIKAKLYEVHKDKCSPSPIGDGSWYECDLTIKLSLNGGTPGVQGGRIGVKWDSTKGEWVSQ
jgi:rare lipoprotein A (peptidoglycan hydrolase)